jgi:tuftelin-interacting protein 11
LEDSDDEEKPVRQEDFPKDFGPKKLKTVEFFCRWPPKC